MNQSHNTSTPKIVGAVVISAVLVVAVYFTILRKDDGTTGNALASTTAQSTTTSTPVSTQTTTTSTTSPTTTQTPTTQTSTSAYKDGTYTANISYRVPHGETNSLSATITIKNGSITDASSNSYYRDGESSYYISSFESSLKSAVVGKKIDGRFSSRIGGASLTGYAFLNALDNIMNQAKA